jgi:hypothetical protein
VASEDERASWVAQWPLLLMLLVATGVLVKIAPLESARPVQERAAPTHYSGVQDVEARLWEDPFVVRSVALKDRDLRKPLDLARDDVPHSPATLTQRVTEAIARDGVKEFAVVGAMVFGTNYAEDIETRRRYRSAVIAGLLQLGYRPENPDAIGYVWMPSVSDKEVSAGVRLPEVVPFEWFERQPDEKREVSTSPATTQEAAGDGKAQGSSSGDQPSSREGNALSKRLLLLWIDEGGLGANPVASVESLLRIVLCGPDPNKLPAKADCRTRTMRPIPILGPAGSGTLKGIYQAVASQPDRLTAPAKPSLRLDFYSSAATIAPRSIDDALPAHLEARSGKTGYDACLFAGPGAKKGCQGDAPGVRVYRVTTGDERLGAALAHELVQLRSLGSPWRDWSLLPYSYTRASERCSGLVVLISEADTEYGQALGRELDYAMKEQCSKGRAVRLQHVRYFRGLDGLVGAATSGAAGSTATATRARGPIEAPEFPTAPPERAEGRSQVDYLRRLSAQLTELNAAERRAGYPGIRAVGVFGSDAYDKLLVFQALRASLPHAVFFTTDLDARFLRPDQAAWARNVVTASGYGIALRPELQGGALPFRDSYQSGMYFATLAALKPTLAGELKPEWFDRAQLFEIGRTRPVELTRGNAGLRTRSGDPRAGPGVYPEDPKQPCTLEVPQNCNAVYVDPGGRGRASLVQRLTDRPGLAFLAAASGLAFVLLTMRTVFTRRAVLPVVVVGIAVIASIGTLAWSDDVSGGGEPLEWLQGVSLWPAVFLRALAALLAVVFLAYGWRSMQGRLHHVGERFFGAPRFGASTPGGRWTLTWPEFLRHLTPARRYACRESDMRAFMLGDGKRVDAVHLWQGFLRDGGFAPAAVRVSVSLLLFLGFALFVFLFEPPSLPYRGQAVRLSAAWSTLLSLTLLWVLVFAVVDATRRAVLLMHCIAEHEIAWPRAAVDDYVKNTGLPEAYLERWIAFSASVEIARSVETLVYLPSVIVLVLVITFSSLFDALNLPLPLLLAFAGAIVYLLYCARSLRIAAESARMAALSGGRDALMQLKGDALVADAATGSVQRDPNKVRAQLEDLLDRIKSEKKGAFSGILQQPYLKALLIPASGYGGISLLEFLLPS